MSKRHQTSRRKAYGRRQHELRQRYDRRHLPEPTDSGWDDVPSGGPIDPFAFLDPRAPRLRYVLGD